MILCGGNSNYFLKINLLISSLLGYFNRFLPAVEMTDCVQVWEWLAGTSRPPTTPSVLY